MSYLERIQVCNNFEPDDYWAWKIDNTVYGWIHSNFLEYLAQWPEVWRITNQDVHLNPKLADYAVRSETVNEILRKLYDQGVIDTWVNEAYPVTLGFDDPNIMEIERAGASFLGIKTFGIHVNGLVRKADGIYVWVGTRTWEKPFWPGKLDQMVAGGQPANLGLMDNLLKEAQEEANIPGVLAQQAIAVGSLDYQQVTSRGLDNSTIYLYDLWLPEDFVPENTDGEVIQFELLPLQEVARLTETTQEFKDNCNLVNINLLLRMKMLTPQHPEYTAILTSMNMGKVEK